MLFGIDPIIGADLLHGLRRMGHGDTLVIADGSFPSATVAARLIPLEAADLRRALRAILSVLPIDEDEPDPVLGMAVIGDPMRNMPAHDLIREEVGRVKARVGLTLVERFAFYEQARKAFLVVGTGERMFYGNVIIRKGTIPADAV